MVGRLGDSSDADQGMSGGRVGDILPDVLRPGLAVVFCGSAAGRRSAEARAYYAGPGNRFWEMLHRGGLTPVHLLPDQYASVLRYGIGLTDLAKAKSGSDAELNRRDYGVRELQQKMKQFAPGMLAFNGKRAASLFLQRPVQYGIQRECLEATRIYVLPSTSGAARRFWDEEPWLVLVEVIAQKDRDRPTELKGT